VSDVSVTGGAGRGHLARRQALTVALLIAGYAGYYLCRSNLSVCMPLITADLTRRGVNADTARVMLGSLASLGVLAYAVGKFPSGNLADYFGGRRNFMAGMAGSIVFTVWFAFAGSLPMFTLAWMGNRLVQSLGWAGAVKITSKWFHFRHYGAVMAAISLSYLFGDALARQFMAALIAQGLGWRSVFGAGALVLAVLLGACAWLLRESPVEIGEPEPSVSPGNLFGQDRDVQPRRLADLLGPFFRSRVFWLACALSLGTTILRETFGLWTPTYFTQAIGMTAAEAASNSAWFPFFGGISVLVCGYLSDRLGGGGRAMLMLGGLGLATGALVVLGLGWLPASRIWPVILVAAVAFLTIGPYSFLAGAMALDFGGKQGSGTASGLIDGVGYLGGVMSGDSVARLSVRYGWNGAFLFLAAIACASSVAAGVLLRHERSACLTERSEGP
jgi:sugar phosphate permease